MVLYLSTNIALNRQPSQAGFPLATNISYRQETVSDLLCLFWPEEHGQETLTHCWPPLSLTVVYFWRGFDTISLCYHMARLKNGRRQPHIAKISRVELHTPNYHGGRKKKKGRVQKKGTIERMSKMAAIKNKLCRQWHQHTHRMMIRVDDLFLKPS